MFSDFLKWIELAWLQLKTFFIEFGLTISTIINDFAIFMTIALLEALIALLSLVFNAFNLVNYMDYFGLLPESILNVLNLLGIGQGLSMLFSAYLLKFTLQLIPFVGLGRK